MHFRVRYRQRFVDLFTEMGTELLWFCIVISIPLCIKRSLLSSLLNHPIKFFLIWSLTPFIFISYQYRVLPQPFLTYPILYCFPFTHAILYFLLIVSSSLRLPFSPVISCFLFTFSSSFLFHHLFLPLTVISHHPLAPSTLIFSPLAPSSLILAHLHRSSYRTNIRSRCCQHRHRISWNFFGSYRAVSIRKNQQHKHFILTCISRLEKKTDGNSRIFVVITVTVLTFPQLNLYWKWKNVKLDCWTNHWLYL